MTTVVISQPQLLPWPGFFELVVSADIYVHLDDALFSRGGFINRVQIKHPSGSKWLTIPLQGRGSFQRICDLTAAGNDWKRQHREVVLQSLAHAPYLAEALDLLQSVYSIDHLPELLVASIENPVAKMGLGGPREWVRSSGLGSEGTSWQRVIGIVKAVGGTRYVTAHGAANYLDHEAFEAAGVAVEYADYSKTPYPQQHGEFTPYVSILDLIANLGSKAGSVIHPRTVPWREFLARRAQSTTASV
jgi:WbqC-like protein family